MAKKTNKKPEVVPGKTRVPAALRFSLLLVLLVFIVYGNSLRNGYAMDDEYFTNGGTSPLNDHIREGFRGIPAIFKSRTFFGEDGGGSSYRPVAAATFAIEYALAGESPQLSHFISLLLYAVILVLLFALLRRWFKAQGDWFAFFIALLFLVHPLHTEVVDNIKCRDELLALLGGIGCLFFAWRFYETKRIVFLVLYPLFFFAGLLSKYTIIPYIAVFPLAFYFFSDLKIKQILLYLLPVVVMALFTAAIQQLWLPPQDRVFQLQENPFYTEHVGMAARLATASLVSGKYLLLQFFPHPLLFYYGYRKVEVVGFDNIFAILSLLVFGALLFLAFKGFRRKTTWAFAILFFGIHIAAYSNLLRPAPGLMAERYALSASLGFCIALVWLVFQLLKNNPERFAWNSSRAGYVFAGVALLFGIRTVVRNGDWSDKMTLYNNDIEYLEESAKANLMLGGHLAESSIALNREGQQLEAQGLRAEAQIRYNRADSMLREGVVRMERAISIDSSYTKAWNNLGSYYFMQADYKRAIQTYKKSIRRDTLNHVAWMNMGLCYANLQNDSVAEQCYRKAIALDSAYMPAYQGLAQVLITRKQTAGAVALLHRATKINPAEANIPLEVLSRIALSQGDTSSASYLMADAMLIKPDNIPLMRNLAGYFSNKGDQPKADTLLQKVKAVEEKEKRSYAWRKAGKRR